MKSEKLLENASANPDSKIRFLEEGFYVAASEKEEYLYSDDGVFIAKGNNCSVINGGFYVIRQNGVASLFNQSGKLIRSGAEGYLGSKDRKRFVAHSTGKYEILDDEGAVTALMPSLPEFLDSGCYCVKAKKGWFVVCRDRCQTLYSPDNKPLLSGSTEIWRYGSGNWFSIEYLGKYFGLCGDEYLSWKKQLAALISRQKPMNKSQADYYRSLWLLMI